MPIIPNLKNIANALCQYGVLFDWRTFQSFKATISALIFFRNQKQADFATLANKSVAAIQYFFDRAKWNVSLVNETRLRILRNKQEAADRGEDDLILDGSPFEKNKDCESEGVSKIWDNRVKRTVLGYEVFGAAVRGKSVTYVLALKIYEAEKWWSLWQAWIHFLKWCLKHTKAMLVIVDRGFRNGYFLQAILQEKRNFLVRVQKDLSIWIFSQKKLQKQKKGRRERFAERIKISLQTKLQNSLHTRRGEFWMFNHVIVDAWKNQFKSECTVIVFHQNGFREPLILVHSKGEISLDEAFSLLQKYYGRWKIEDLFLELKCYFQIENFKITTIQGISRYLMMCMVAHGLLQLKQIMLDGDSLLCRFIQFILKKKRNIKTRKVFPYLTLESLKLFYEMIHLPIYDFNSLFRLFLATNQPRHA